jgi:hypothetical protein
MGRRNRAQRLDNFLQAMASQRAIDEECSQTEHRHANPGIQALEGGRFVTHLAAGLSSESNWEDSCIWGEKADRAGHLSYDARLRRAGRFVDVVF